MKTITKKELKEKLAAHQMWLEAMGKGERLVLNGYNLPYVDLSDCDMRYALIMCSNLSCANLSRSNLKYAQLTRSILADAYMQGAELDGANLCDLLLCRADLRACSLNGADLSGANMEGAVLELADLREANLSRVKGLKSPIRYLNEHFETVPEGFIAYKRFGLFFKAPDEWEIKPGSIIEETVNFDRCALCGSGINVAASVRFLEDKSAAPIWRVLIRYEWLAGVCVPYGTCGNIRCERVQLLSKLPG